MTLLQGIFGLVLDVLRNAVTTDFFTSILWLFVLVMIALLLYKIWNEVF